MTFSQKAHTWCKFFIPFAEAQISVQAYVAKRALRWCARPSHGHKIASTGSLDWLYILGQKFQGEPVNLAPPNRWSLNIFDFDLPASAG